MFNKIMIAICNYDSYFVQKNNAFNVINLIVEQKLIATLQMFAYGGFGWDNKMGKAIMSHWWDFAPKIDYLHQ